MDSSATEVSTPHFSICIPVYNGEKFVRTAVESVLKQTFTDWEIIIGDNASTDGTWSLLQEYQGHPRIRIFRNEKNLGLGGNLNRLLDAARGEWMGLLAADDFYEPHALETVDAVTRGNPRVALWIHAHLCHGPGVTPQVAARFSEKREFCEPGLTERFYLKGGEFGEISNFLFCLGAYRKNCRHRFLENSTHVDGDFWMRFIRGNPGRTALFWPEPLVHVLIHPESLSSEDESSGRGVTEIFVAVENSLSVGWSRKVLLLQMARMIWIWIKFFRKIPLRKKGMVFRTLYLLMKAFCGG